MNHERTLSDLIDQNRLAREAYYACKGQESWPLRKGQTDAARRELTAHANVAWQTAEGALWRFRASSSRQAS